MGKMEKFVFVSGENQEVDDVLKLDRHLLDIENTMVETLEALSKKGRDIRVMDFEVQGKLNICKYYFPLGMVSIAYSRTLSSFEKETIDKLLNKMSGGETINWKTEHVNITYVRLMHSVKSNFYHLSEKYGGDETKVLDFCRRVVIIKDEESNRRFGFVFITLPLSYDKSLAAIASDTFYYMLSPEPIEYICEENETHNTLMGNYLNVPEVSDEENVSNPGYKWFNQAFIDFEIIQWQTYVKDNLYNGKDKKYVN